MSEVVDLNQRRIEKVVKEAKPQTTTDVVQLLACSNCQNSSFRLAHDKRIICALCCYEIGPLRWYDVNDPGPAA